MLTFQSFVQLVEIQTKVASMIPFFLGTLFALYRYRSVKLSNFLLMFISLLCFDMATTAINNYYDYKKAVKTHGYGYEVHNAIVNYRMKESTVLATISILVGAAVISGLLLVLRTNIVVLGIGALSFLVGILYSFGPVPISRMPLGEVFSGFFMGFVIPFLAVYIHHPDLVQLSGSLENVQINIQLLEVVVIFLVALPPVAGIANIMLANNICDMEDDLQNRRYTLPIYLGKDRALWLFRALYYTAYADLVLLVVARILSPVSLLVLLTLIPVRRNISRFMEVQTKRDTFVVAVQNFVLLAGMQLITLALVVGLGLL